ncbi:MAG: iron ABC transporter substrate-binding protein, partial [Methanosarcina sp.]
MKINYSNKLNQSILIGVLIAALIITSGCSDKSTFVEDSAVSAPEESSEIANTHATVEPAGITITDGFGRNVTIPENTERVVCSGAGCLRYLVYLQAQDSVVGVDSLEKKEEDVEGRPYALANPQLKNYPLIGEFRGKDDPEKIIAIDPQVVLKTGITGQSSATNTAEADMLQNKTDIPVVMFPYGSLTNEKDRAEMNSSLRIMGEVTGKQERAEEVIAY